MERLQKNSIIAEETATHILAEMKQIVENKLAGVKVFIPIIFTLITSLLAFVFTQNVNINDKNNMDFYMLFIAVLMILFVILILCYNTRAFYKEKISNSVKLSFDYINVKTYWLISDKDFINNLQKMFNRELSEIELIQAISIKQKVNEYRYKKRMINIINGTMIAVACLMIAICIGYICS